MSETDELKNEDETISPSKIFFQIGERMAQSFEFELNTIPYVVQWRIFNGYRYEEKTAEFFIRRCAIGRLYFNIKYHIKYIQNCKNFL